jgi:hypothetical protein
LVSFTNSNILSTSNIDFIETEYAEVTSLMEDGNKLENRFFSVIGILYIGWIIAIYLVRFFLKVIKKILTSFCSIFCCCSKSSKIEAHEN